MSKTSPLYALFDYIHHSKILTDILQGKIARRKHTETPATKEEIQLRVQEELDKFQFERFLAEEQRVSTVEQHTQELLAKQQRYIF